MSFQPCRRQILGAGAGIAAALALTSCGGSEEELEQGAVLGNADDVEPGHAIPALVGDVPIILARTPAGDFRAFSAICTHQGCKVVPDEQTPEILQCPCHRSEFDTFTGEVLKGPASEDLPEIDVDVKDGMVVAT